MQIYIVIPKVMMQNISVLNFCPLPQVNVPSPQSSSRPAQRGFREICLLGALLGLLPARTARAEDSLTAKAQSWQESNHRIRVDSQYGLLEADPTTESHVKVMGVIDSITGATPTGEKPLTPGGPVPLSRMEDERKAWDANFSYQLPRVSVSASFGNSRESDYVSNGYSLNTVTDFNQKNTNLLLGWGHTDDRIMEKFWANDRFKKGNDFIAGVTQLLSPNTSVTGNISYGRSSGFLNDPYKIVSTTNLDLDPGTYYTPPENRPQKKEKLSVFLGAVQNFEKISGALDASYRYYQDSYDIQAHTVELKWVQTIGKHVRVEPLFRYTRQSAAKFYYADLDLAGVVTTYDQNTFETGTGSGPFYSSDYRLSQLETYNLGLTTTWLLNDHVAFSIGYERYIMHGLDSSTPRDTYPSASVYTFGIKLTR